MNPGLAALWDEEIERRKMKDMNADNIGPPASQPRLKVQPTSSHFAFKSQLEERLAQLNDEVMPSYLKVFFKLLIFLFLIKPGIAILY